MGTKKWLVLVIILAMTMGMLTGCSPNEKEYYNLTTEASTQKVYQDSGSIELILAQLPASMFENEDSTSKDLLIKSLNQHRIDYSGSVDLNQGIFQYDFTMVDNKTGVQSHILSIISKNNRFYIKVDDLIDYLKGFGDLEENQHLDEIFWDIEYVSISPEDLGATMPLGMQANDNFMQQSIQQQLIVRRLLDELRDHVYDKYQSGLISKNNNQYVLALRGVDSINILKPAVIYTINNIDSLGIVLRGFLNCLAQDELAALGLNNELKREALQGIDEMVADVNQNHDEYLNEIEVMSAAANEELAQTVNDSELVFTIEKKDAQTYQMTSKLHLHITAGKPVEEFDVTLNLKDTLKACNNVQVVVPTGRIISYEELEKRMPIRMDVYVDDGRYSLNKGFSSSGGLINVRLEDDQTYLPLRTVAESMGEKVVWDAESQQAYVEQNGQLVIMAGPIVDDQVLVRSRDWEGLGYKISWDESNRMVSIENR